MNIIFLGGYFPLDRAEEILMNSRGVVQNAANNLQWSIIKGLNYYYKNLQTLTLPYIGSYPFHYKKPYFNSSDNSVGFINFFGLSHIHRYIKAKKALKQRVKKSEDTYIVVYAIHAPFLKAATDIKKKNPNVKICLIAPDMPQYMSENKGFVRRFFKFIDLKVIQSCLKKVDSFVLLTDQMAEGLGIENKPWVRIEGVFDSVETKEHVEKEKIKTILYTGTLARAYGIMNLLDAFSAISNSDYQLWICGEGNCREEIEKRVQSDLRIKYWGQLPYSEVLALQKRATVLVNPRTSEGEYTKYSFPSKTMEYMASGTPCIMHNLSGIPKEYLEFCFIVEHENAEELKNTIEYACEKTQDELNEFGNKAKQFILMKKNPVCQIKKMEKLFNKTNK